MRRRPKRTLSVFLSGTLLSLFAVTSSGCVFKSYDIFHHKAHYPFTKPFPPPAEDGNCFIEPPFYGYNATCWRQWPKDWVGCPPCGEEVISEVVEEKLTPAKESPNSQPPAVPAEEPAVSPPGELQPPPDVPLPATDPTVEPATEPTPTPIEPTPATPDPMSEDPPPAPPTGPEPPKSSRLVPSSRRVSAVDTKTTHQSAGVASLKQSASPAPSWDDRIQRLLKSQRNNASSAVAVRKRPASRKPLIVFSPTPEPAAESRTKAQVVAFAASDSLETPPAAERPHAPADLPAPVIAHAERPSAAAGNATPPVVRGVVEPIRFDDWIDVGAKKGER